MGEKLKPDQLMQLATGYWPSCVLNTAVQLGVFRGLDQPKSAETLAGELNLNPGHLIRLLRALVSLELLEETDQTFSIPSDVAPFLGPHAQASLESAIQYNADLYDLWGQLDTCISTGKPVQPTDHHLGVDPESTRRFVMGMESRGRMMAPLIVQALPSPPGTRMLDVACGSGIISRRYARQHPDVEVNLFDLPAVLQVAEELWLEEGCPAVFHPGSYREDDLPEGPFDMILYTGALHQESEAAAQALFHHVSDRLAPSGVFCIVDFLLESNGAKPGFSALFSLNMMLIQPHGHVFTCAEVEALLRSAGFTDIESSAQAAGPYGMITAHKK